MNGPKRVIALPPPAKPVCRLCGRATESRAMHPDGVCDNCDRLRATYLSSILPNLITNLVGREDATTLLVEDAPPPIDAEIVKSGVALALGMAERFVFVTRTARAQRPAEPPAPPQGSEEVSS